MTVLEEEAVTPAEQSVRALAQRLAAAADVLLPQAGDADGAPGERAGRILGDLVQQVRRSPDASAIWLLWTALSSAFPTDDELADARRVLALESADEATAWLLDACYISARNAGSPHLQMDVLQDAVVVEVDFCARHDHHTGIQRVVRETMPRWDRDHDIVLVAWTDSHGAMRRLTPLEEDRVLRWSQSRTSDLLRDQQFAAEPRLAVPWRSRVVLPENVAPQRAASLAALARYSGNALTAIGYDCIPLVSPELISPDLPDRFMRYLTVIKHAHTVAGISSSATQEFLGFAQMMQPQGLPGPRVVEVQLPVEVPPVPADTERAVRDEVPLVVSVGSLEPRKNQLAVLYAAERLWREGLRFRLRFIGGARLRSEFDARANRLAHEGYPVSISIKITDEELWAAVREARFSAFPSLHEGYGLPVAESLAYGTPALTTSYGSTAEIAAAGGAVLVDPRDDDAVLEAMRRLITDDGLVTELTRAALARPARTWDDYAAELWQALVADVELGTPRPGAAGIRDGTAR